jgi:hypothetical protein
MTGGASDAMISCEAAARVAGVSTWTIHRLFSAGILRGGRDPGGYRGPGPRGVKRAGGPLRLTLRSVTAYKDTLRAGLDSARQAKLEEAVA